MLNSRVSALNYVFVNGKNQGLSQEFQYKTDKTGFPLNEETSPIFSNY